MATPSPDRTVRQVLAARFPELAYGIARFDDPTTVFLREDDAGRTAVVRGALEGVPVVTVRSWVQDRLGVDPRGPLTAAHWLTFPTPLLRGIATGPVEADGTGELAALRQRLSWYPDDVWRYVLAAAWARVGEAEREMPEAGRSGDELGSALLAGRLARDAVHLTFLLAREWAPGPAGLGTAAARLDPGLAPLLAELLGARTWPERQDAYAGVAERLLARQAALGLTGPLPTRAELLPGRPFWVVRGGRVAGELLRRVGDPEVARLATRPLLGAVGQWTDGVAPTTPGWLSALRGLYG